jgi:hypothetical protein
MLRPSHRNLNHQQSFASGLSRFGKAGAPTAGVLLRGIPQMVRSIEDPDRVFPRCHKQRYHRMNPFPATSCPEWSALDDARVFSPSKKTATHCA